MAAVKNRKKTVLLLCLLAMLAAGCGKDTLRKMGASWENTAVVPGFCTVRLIVDGQTYTQRVKAGDTIKPAVEVPDGLAIPLWRDASGHAVDLETTPVMADTVYSAALFPDLYRHAPYLFPDKNGFIRPDETLIGGEFAAALEALASSKAVYNALSLPEDDAPVTKALLERYLTDLFPAEGLTAALRTLPDGEVSRASFAAVMNTLLGRQDTEHVRITEKQALPRDLALDRADAPDLLAAALDYEAAADGKPITQAVLDMPWEPGFTILDGWLYYADENGVLLRDGQVGTLVFGSDGRYTSTDAELDTIVAGLLDGFIMEHPEAERYDTLYTAFRYCRNEFSYANRGLLDYGATGWETEKAKEMFQTGAGNCYSFAAAFCVLARGLGYDAHCISGLVLELSRPHGWVEITVDGENFFYDPELAYASRIGERDNWGEDMFAIPMWDTWSWRYIWQ